MHIVPRRQASTCPRRAPNLFLRPLLPPPISCLSANGPSASLLFFAAAICQHTCVHAWLISSTRTMEPDALGMAHRFSYG